LTKNISGLAISGPKKKLAMPTSGITVLRTSYLPNEMKKRKKPCDAFKK
jgi:hypothetical protein